MQNDSAARSTGLIATLWSALSWSILATAISQGGTLVASIALAHVLGVRDFGLYAFFQSAVNVAFTFVQSSFGLMATRYVAEFKDHEPQRALQIIILGRRASLWLGLALAVPVVLLGIHANADLSLGAIAAFVLLSSVVMPAGAVSQFQVGVLIGLHAWQRSAVVALGYVIAIIVMATMGGWFAGAPGAWLGLTLALCIRAAIASAQLRQSVGLQTRAVAVDATDWSQLYGDFAIPGLLGAVGFAFGLWFGNYFLLRQPGGREELGLFAAAYLLRTVVVFVPGQLATAGLALLGRTLARDDAGEYQRILWSSIGIAAVVSISLAGSFALLGPRTMLLFGSDFRPGALLFHSILVAAVLEALASAAYQSLPGRARMWRSLFVVAIPRDATFLLCCLLLIPSLKSSGLAIALLASQAVALLGITAANIGQRPLSGWPRPTTKRAHE
jgi:O-antigen/teichoic acid export membrane protein